MRNRTEETTISGTPTKPQQQLSSLFDGTYGDYEVGYSEETSATSRAEEEVFKGDLFPKEAPTTKDTHVAPTPEQIKSKEPPKIKHARKASTIKLKARFPTLTDEQINHIVKEQFDSTLKDTSIEDKKDICAEYAPALTSPEMELIVDALTRTTKDEDEICAYDPKTGSLKSNALKETQLQDEKSQIFAADVIAQADEYRILLADELDDRYQKGHADLSPDKWKADKFRRISHPEATKLPDTWRRTSTVYNAVNHTNAIRLGALRANRLPTLVGVSSAVFSLINNIFSVGTYGPRFVFDAVVLIKDTVGTKEEREITPSVSDRFSRAFYKDGRNTRMANDFFWFFVNVFCLVVSAGLSAWLNLGLFIFDFGVDAYKYRKTVEKYKNLYEKIDATINQLKKKLETTDDANSLNEINKSIQKYEYIRSRLEANQQTEKNLKRYALLMTTVILVGMICFLLPPVGATLGLTLGFVATKVLTFGGAGLALSGSLFGGVGERAVKLFTYLRDKITSKFVKKSAETYKANLRKYTDNATFSRRSSSTKKPLRGNTDSQIKRDLTAAASRKSSGAEPSIPTAPIINAEKNDVKATPQQTQRIEPATEDTQKEEKDLLQFYKDFDRQYSSAQQATTFKPAAKMNIAKTTPTVECKQTKKPVEKTVRFSRLHQELQDEAVRKLEAQKERENQAKKEKEQEAQDRLGCQRFLADLKRSSGALSVKRAVAPASHFGPRI